MGNVSFDVHSNIVYLVVVSGPVPANLPDLVVGWRIADV